MHIFANYFRHFYFSKISNQSIDNEIFIFFIFINIVSNVYLGTREKNSRSLPD